MSQRQGEGSSSKRTSRNEEKEHEQREEARPEQEEQSENSELVSDEDSLVQWLAGQSRPETVPDYNDMVRAILLKKKARRIKKIVPMARSLAMLGNQVEDLAQRMQEKAWQVAEYIRRLDKQLIVDPRQPTQDLHLSKWAEFLIREHHKVELVGAGKTCRLQEVLSKEENEEKDKERAADEEEMRRMAERLRELQKKYNVTDSPPVVPEAFADTSSKKKEGKRTEPIVVVDTPVRKGTGKRTRRMSPKTYDETYEKRYEYYKRNPTCKALRLEENVSSEQVAQEYRKTCRKGAADYLALKAAREYHLAKRCGTPVAGPSRKRRRKGEEDSEGSSYEPSSGEM